MDTGIGNILIRGISVIGNGLIPTPYWNSRFIRDTLKAWKKIRDNGEKNTGTKERTEKE